MATHERTKVSHHHRLKQIDRLFQQALDLDADQRPDFLAHACGDDNELRIEVVQLLRDALTEDPLLHSGGAINSHLVADSPLADTTLLLDRRQIRTSGHSESPSDETFGPYRILSLLGRGGMGVVYLAERADGSYNQQVAIKTMRGSAGPRAIARFRRERQVLANLQHPHIARLLDGGVTATNEPYLVVEHVEGKAIDRYCHNQNLSLEQRIDLLCQVCDAVDAAHRQLVVHRDIKPSNILVTPQGEVKLLDFGIAKLLEDSDANTTLFTEQPLMTLQYASPEQFRGNLISIASDVYQLGLLAFELLTGKLPYTLAGATPTEAEQRITAVDPELPSTLLGQSENEDASEPFPVRARELQGDLDTIVMKALRKEPEHRYASVANLRKDFQNYLDDLPVTARPATRGYRLRKLLRRHATAAAIAAVLALTVSGLTVGFIHRLQVESKRTQLEAERARHERTLAEQSKAEAEEVTDFLIGLFQYSNPNKARGKTLTAREVFERGAASLEDELTDRPRIRARLTQAVGRVYLSMGLHDQAIDKLQESLKMDESLPQANIGSIAETLDYLGLSQAIKGKSDQAVLTYERALRLLDESHEPDAFDRGRLLVGLARALQGEGRYQQAEQLARAATEWAEERHGPWSPHLDQALSTHSNILSELGQYEEAGSKLRRSLDIEERLYGADSPRVASGLVNLAALYGELGQPAKAAETLEQALPVLETAFGASNLNVGITRLNLCISRIELKDFTRAEDHCQKALETSETIGQPRLLSGAYSTLGGLRMLQGRTAEGVELRGRALTVTKAGFAPDHEFIAEGHNDLGEALYAHGRPQEAEPHFLRAQEIFSATLGEDHLHLSGVLFNLGKIYEDRADFIAAEANYRRALDIRIANQPEGALGRREVREALDLLLSRQGRDTEASVADPSKLQANGSATS